MNPSNHISTAEMQSPLSGDPAVDLLESAAEHVQQCDRCQAELQTAAARPEIWDKATKWFSDPEITMLSHSGLPPVDSVDATGPSLNDLLETPTHPEFLGRVPGYDIEREVGRGGMGVVFKAFDTELHRAVAIKFLSPQMALNGTARQRFAREARAAAAVFHPNVLPIHGVSSHRDIPYLVMPYVSGPSLQQLINQHGPLDEKELIRMAMQIAAGLSAAHLQGLVHRDIKPANILVEADVSRVSVTDFGLARAIDDASMTQSGSFLGTPNYMSPEQATGKRVDGRSDLFSLGSVMYFMATGRLPFRAESPVCVLNRITNDQPTSVRELNSELTATTCDIMERLLKKQPDERFTSASKLHEVLQQQLAHLHRPGFAPPPQLKTAGGSGWQRNATVWATMVGVFFVLALALVVFDLQNGGEDDAGNLLQSPATTESLATTESPATTENAPTTEGAPAASKPGTLQHAEASALEAEATARQALDDATRRAKQVDDERRNGQALPRGEGLDPRTPPLAPPAPAAPDQRESSHRATDSWLRYWFGWLGF